MFYRICVEVWNLTLTMLGTTDSPSLHAKAAESHGLALFVRHLLEKSIPSFEEKLPHEKARRGKFLLEAAKAAEKLDQIFLARIELYPVHKVKKYSTYRDESFNGLIARIARSCHRRTWANVIHWKCQALHKKSHDYVLAGNTFKKI